MSKFKLSTIEINESQFVALGESYNLKVRFIGNNIATIKSKHDSWQVELQYRENKGRYEIRLNHLNKTNSGVVHTKERYHLQGYFTTYKSLMNYIVKHDRYTDSGRSYKASSGIKRINKINNLFKMIENNNTPKLKPQTY